MSQFYKAQMHKDEARRYYAVLGMDPKERAEIAASAQKGMDRYTVYGGSNQREYKENLSDRLLYSRTDEQLRALIDTHERAEKEELEKELERCRKWLTEAFALSKKMKSTPKNPKTQAFRDKNLSCARSWVTRYWPEYKAARKMVRGF
jgi:hypothetical protein